VLDQWIQAARRLIENHQIGITHEGLHQAHLLTVPLREFPDLPAEIQTQPFRQLLDA
jgi:hypothetical protein